MLKEGVHGQQLPTARAYKPRGTGSAAHAVVGAQGSLRGVAVPNGSGTPASGDGESCPGGDRCSRSACGGQLLPTAPLGGWGVLPRRWSVLKEGLRGVAVPHGLGTSSGGRGVLPRRWSVLKEGFWGR